MSTSYYFARDLSADELSKKQQGSGCLAYDPLVDPTYGYVPNRAVGIIFAVIFGVIMVLHIGQASIKKKWWYYTFAIAALGESMGWAARAAAHKCPYNSSIFSLQISILIISPCFTSASIYYILSQLIELWRRQGHTHYSPIGAKVYLIIFISFDLLSIVIQGVGGGLASAAGSDNKNTAPGTHIMMAGIIIQLVSMSVFCFLWLWTIFRARAHLRTDSSAVCDATRGAAGGKKLNGMRLILLVATTCLSTTCIVVRNFYRSVELSQGWKGYLITHEIYFCLLDGMLMALALLAFNIVHPAWLLDPNSEKTITDDEKKGASDASLP